MWKGGINTLGVLKILTQQFARGARSVVRRFEVTLHDERLFRTTVAKCTTESKTLPLYPLRCAKRGRSWHARVASPTGRRLQESNTQRSTRHLCVCEKNREEN